MNFNTDFKKGLAVILLGLTIGFAFGKVLAELTQLFIAQAATVVLPAGPATKGDLIIGSSSVQYGLLGVGTDGKVLTASSTAPRGVSWETAAAAGGSVAGNATEIQYKDGGAFAASSLLTFASTTGIFSVTGLASSSQLRAPSGTIGVLTITNATATHATITGLDITNGTSSGNIQTATLKTTGQVDASSTLNVQGILDSRGGFLFTTATSTGHLTSTNVSSTELTTTNLQVTGTCTGCGSAAYWVTVPGTPSRTDNDTFTITDTGGSSGYVSLISKGAVLKWTDTGVVKQAMVSTSTYSANTVTIDILGDTLAAGATMNTFKYGLEKARSVQFAIAGTLATGSDLAGRFYAPYEMHIFAADAFVATAGTTNATTFDINRDGTTIFTTKPSISSGATSDVRNTADSGIVVNEASYLSVDIDAVSTTAPVDAYLTLYWAPERNQHLP